MEESRPKLSSEDKVLFHVIVGHIVWIVWQLVPCNKLSQIASFSKYFITRVYANAITHKYT